MVNIKGRDEKMLFYRIVFAVWIASVSGCASFPEVISPKEITPGVAVALEAGEVLVFGKVSLIENGEARAPKWHPYSTGAMLFLDKQTDNGTPKDQPNAISSASARQIRVPLKTRKNGEFSVIIPSGRYVVAYVMPTYPCGIKPELAFDAPTPGKAYYLGEMIVDVDTSFSLLRMDFHCISLNFLEVTDQYESERSALLKMIPELPAESITKALMTRISGHFPSLPYDHY
jgi:hypothetical protein